MDIGSFYFLSDEYYDRFPNCGLMWNKGEHAGRPCFYAVKDWEEDGVYWMVPISSKIEKYKSFLYNISRAGG